MATINLDDARAARLESEAGPHDVVFNGATYEVPAEAPFQFVEWFARGQVEKAMPAALGDEAWKDLRTNGSRDDVDHLIDALLTLWGLRNPESESEDAQGE